MDNNQKIDILGTIGEKIVSNMLNSLNLGLNIIHSTDKFDSEKDFLIDGKKVEVKTQAPWLFEDSFSFKPNQLKKCGSVDVLYFVSVPIQGRYDPWEGYIWRADPSKLMTRRRFTKEGREMVLIPRKQEAMVPVTKMTQEELSELKKYTISQFGR